MSSTGSPAPSSYQSPTPGHYNQRRMASTGGGRAWSEEEVSLHRAQRRRSMSLIHSRRTISSKHVSTRCPTSTLLHTCKRQSSLAASTTINYPLAPNADAELHRYHPLVPHAPPPASTPFANNDHFRLYLHPTARKALLTEVFALNLPTTTPSPSSPNQSPPLTTNMSFSRATLSV